MFDGSFIPGFVFGTGHLVGMQPKKTSNSPALKTPARPSVDITVNAEIVLSREQNMALTTASKVGQTWMDADALILDDVGRLMLSLPVDSCIRTLHMKAQFAGVEHEVLRHCWSTDWSIGRRYVARYEARQDLSRDRAGPKNTIARGGRTRRGRDGARGIDRAIQQGSVDRAVDAVRAAILRRDSGSARAVHSFQVSKFVRGSNSHFWCSLLGRYQVGRCCCGRPEQGQYFRARSGRARCEDLH